MKPYLTTLALTDILLSSGRKTAFAPVSGYLTNPQHIATILSELAAEFSRTLAQTVKEIPTR